MDENPIEVCGCLFPRASKDGRSGICGGCKGVITDAEGRPITERLQDEEENNE